MDFAADFTAIDFETANRRPDSACQLAAVRVRDGKIAESEMWMIRPRPLFFSQTHIRIHGITPERVRNESEFGDLWPQIAERLGNDCLVAHNARFDINVLLACLRGHGHPAPRMEFICTRNVARRSWPGRRRYGLKPLADWLGIRFRHHDALEDSIACAKILLAAGIDSGATGLSDLERKLSYRRGSAGDGIATDWGQSNRRRRSGPATSATLGDSSKVAESATPFHRLLAGGPGSLPEAKRGAAEDSASQLDLQRLMVRAEFIRPLAGRSVVFSGRLSVLSREQAQSLTERLGGRYEETISEQTDLIVMGSESAIPANLDPGTPVPGTPVPGTDVLGAQISGRQGPGRQTPGGFDTAPLVDNGGAASESSETTSSRSVRIIDEKGFLGLIVAKP